MPDTQSDGFDEFRDIYEQLVHQDAIIGYCFYTLQDVGSALDFREMQLAFGPSDPKDEKTKGVKVGKTIVEALNANGLKTDWNGKSNQRIKIVDFDWQRRKIMTGTFAAIRGPEE